MNVPVAIETWAPALPGVDREVSADPPQRAMQRPAESALANRLSTRDPAALEEIYDRFASITFGFLVKTLRDRGLAEDVQQQVYLEIWQRAASFDPDRGTLLAWVMTITRSRAIDQLRRRGAQPVGGEVEAAPAAAVDDVEQLVERYRIAELLARLHPEEAQVLRLRFYEDLTQAEIAKQTGIPLGTVKMRMVSALHRLREMMGVEA
jgi:RNA polymerase sigma-70 factor (ECF subfamily)